MKQNHYKDFICHCTGKCLDLSTLQKMRKTPHAGGIVISEDSPWIRSITEIQAQSRVHREPQPSDIKFDIHIIGYDTEEQENYDPPSQEND